MKIVFLTSLDGRDLESLLKDFPELHVVRDYQELQREFGDLLLSFGTSVIVPMEIIRRYEIGALNIHGASPRFPGRDPHHWAAYESADSYGATAHVMTEKVDDGPIIKLELSPTSGFTSPEEYRDLANESALVLVRDLITEIISTLQIPDAMNVDWSGSKRSRNDLLEKCIINADISKSELERRIRAFDHNGYSNFRICRGGELVSISAAELLAEFKLSAE